VPDVLDSVSLGLGHNGPVHLQHSARNVCDIFGSSRREMMDCDRSSRPGEYILSICVDNSPSNNTAIW